MADPINPEKLETQEAVEIRPEARAETSEQNAIQGAEMLEEPQSGSFVSALQAFVTWVKTLVD